jgi:hypothetical protein
VTPRPAHWGISFVLLVACGEDPPAPTPAPEVAVAPPAEPPPTEDKIYEVTLASTPTGARVLLSGAEIGTTPHPLKFKRKTTVQVVADAYLPAEITVDETSDPNIVVTLQPDPAAATATGGGGGTGGDAKPSTGKTEAASTTKTSTSDASKSSPSKPATPTQPTTDPSTPTPKPASSLPYPNVSAAKSDYQSGKIDRDAYDQAVRKLKARRNAKIEVIRAKYQAGEFDKDEYNRRKRIIDNEYRGGV